MKARRSLASRSERKIGLCCCAACIAADPRRARVRRANLDELADTVYRYRRPGKANAS